MMTNRQVSSRPSASLQAPQVIRLIEVRRFDLAIELHVFAQVELVGDVVQVAQVFRLTGEAFLPVPFIQQILGEREAIGVAFRVEAGSGIAVPVPGSAEIGGGLEHGGIHSEVGQKFDLIDSGHSGADDDYLVVRLGPVDHDLLHISFTGDS